MPSPSGVPYPPRAVRSVTLVADDGALWLDVTARVPVATGGVDPQRVAGVDIGIIHPHAAAGPDGSGLVMSGRAIRAEARVHLEDSKRRGQRVRQAHHEAACEVIAWALQQRVGTIGVGDLGTILDAPPVRRTAGVPVRGGTATCWACCATRPKLRVSPWSWSTNAAPPRAVPCAAPVTRHTADDDARPCPGLGRACHQRGVARPPPGMRGSPR